MTHYLVLRVETVAGTMTTQALLEEIASNLESVPGVASGVVAATHDKDDIVGMTGVLKRKTLLVVF